MPLNFIVRDRLGVRAGQCRDWDGALALAKWYGEGATIAWCLTPVWTVGVDDDDEVESIIRERITHRA